jgi:transcription elongation GreA/GreB family factor
MTGIMMTKQTLYALCQTYVDTRIDTARSAMEAAQASANTEEKSSAGDKYETGRAMAQNERDRHATQLVDAQGLRAELARIDPEQVCAVARPGALVETSGGTFFISISAGKLTADGRDYFAVSLASPIAQALAGHGAGDVVRVNGRELTILYCS